MKKGWLVVNGFLKSAKFSEIYNFFLRSASQFNMQIDLVPSNTLSGVINEDTVSNKPDFVLFWDKDVHLAKLLEKRGFKLFNNAAAVETCDSKILTALALLNKVPLPQTVFSPKTFEGVGYSDLSFVDNACERLGVPLVVKEAYGSFGEQVYLAHTVQQAKEIVSGLCGKDFLLQKFVAESCGRDVRLNVVGGKVVNAILRQSHKDFRSNVTLGGSAKAYQPTEEEIAVAERASQEIGLDFCGVDIMFGKDGPLLCEVNSNPHFKSTFDVTGVDLSCFILQHIASKIN